MRPARRSPMPRLGFSLIELLVVLVIVSIAMGMMLPRFRITAYTAVQLMGMQMAQVDYAKIFFRDFI